LEYARRTGSAGIGGRALSASPGIGGPWAYWHSEDGRVSCLEEGLGRSCRVVSGQAVHGPFGCDLTPRPGLRAGGPPSADRSRRPLSRLVSLPVDLRSSSEPARSGRRSFSTLLTGEAQVAGVHLDIEVLFGGSRDDTGDGEPNAGHDGERQPGACAGEVDGDGPPVLCHRGDVSAR